jgi:hypothetical protein
MYFAAVILLMLVLPAVSVAIEALRTPGGADLMALVGKWFTFWAVGARLFLAGATQSLRPQFTAQSISDIKDQGALAIVREVGFGNLAIGALGLASLVRPDWVVPAAIAGGLYYGLALWLSGAWTSLPPEPKLQGADGARLRSRDLRLACRLHCEPCRLDSTRARYSVGTPELLSSGSSSPVSQQCSMRILLTNDHSGCVKAQGRFLSMKK